MRRSRTTFAFWALLLSCIVSILPGCAGSSAGKVVSITLTPSPVSVAYGQHNIVLTATAVNSSNGVVSTAFTFASSNTSAVSIAPDGTLCGGTWDANFVTCSKPATLQPATATITVTAQTVTATVQAYVHEKVDSVVITGVLPSQPYPGIGSTAGSLCASSTQCICTSLSLPLTSSTSLPQFQATAYSNDPTVCVPPKSSAPCDITADLTAGTTSTGGTVDHSAPFQWSSSDTTIATISTSGTSVSNSGTLVNTTATLPAGTVTPIGPGQANIFASTAGVNSPSVPFATCPVTSITLTATNAANSGVGPLTISPGGTQALSAAVTDTAGKTITYSTQNATNLAFNYPALSWLSTDLYAATATVQTTTIKTTTNGITTNQTLPLPTATATGVTNGVAALVASCTPPSCNKNLFPAYSNPIVTTNSGSGTAVAYIASSQSRTMLAINLTSGSPLSLFPVLPAVPNSFLFNRQGTKAMLGSPNGVFAFDPVAVSFTTFAFNGTVLGISPDGSLAAVFGQVAGVNQNSIGIINLSLNALMGTFPITGKPTDSAQPSVAADFSLDSRYLWVSVTPTGGTTGRIYVYTTGVGSTFFTVTNPVNGLAFLPSGPLVYLAGDTSAASIAARATCFGGQQNAVSASVVTSGADLPNGVVDVQPGVAPTNIRALPNGTGILALDLPNNIDVVTLANPEVPFVGCPPTQSAAIDNPVAPQNLGLGSPTVNQFLVMPNSNTAVLTSTGGSVVLVNLANLQLLSTTTVTLTNSATLQDPTTNLVFKGDVPADSSGFVVGGNDGELHVISLSTSADAAFDISGLGFLQADGVTAALPNLVAIRNQ